jgi:hypothetical protein
VALLGFVQEHCVGDVPGNETFCHLDPVEIQPVGLGSQRDLRKPASEAPSILLL